MYRPLAFAALLAAAFVPAAHAEEAKGRISITGTASVFAEPDIAIVSAGVESKGGNARAALDANKQAMSRIFEQIDALGVDKKDVQTSNFSVGPDWEHGPNGPKEAGFRVSNLVTIRLRDVSRLGTALDVLVGAGANRAGNVQFTVENAETLLNTARRDAVAEARERAELYADAAGVKLGSILDIREGSGAMPMPMGGFAMAEAAVMDAVPVASGQNELSVAVTITWALKE